MTAESTETAMDCEGELPEGVCSRESVPAASVLSRTPLPHIMPVLEDYISGFYLIARTIMRNITSPSRSNACCAWSHSEAKT